MDSTSKLTWRMLTCTYGGADVTYTFGRKLLPIVNNLQPKFDFTVSKNFFFGYDPNPGIQKVCVVVYQIALLSPDGKSVRSEPKSVAAIDGQSIHLDFLQLVPNGTPDYVPPRPNPPLSQQYLVSAYWFDKDVTAAARSMFEAYPWIPYDVQHQFTVPDQNIPLTVSSDKLGPDPAVGTNKSFSVTFASFSTPSWLYHAAVDLQQPMSWTLTIPTVVFPNYVGLQIIQATWGGTDISAWVRDKYRQAMVPDSFRLWLNIPDIWNFTASNEYLNGDPNYGVQKAFVMIYRLAHMYPQDYNAMTGIKYMTVGKPLSGLRTFAVREGGTGSLVANNIWRGPDIYITPPPRLLNGVPWVFKAIYSTVDVTHYFQWYIASCCMPPGGGKPIPIQSPWVVNLPSIAGGDPWQNVQKNLTMLMGFPTADGKKYQIGKWVALQESDNFVIPLKMPGKGVGTVTWDLRAPCVAFPKIVGVDTSEPFTWNPRFDLEWTMDENQSKTVNLVNDAGCTPGFTYSVSFDVEAIKDPPAIQVTCSSDADLVSTLSLDSQQLLTLMETSAEATLITLWDDKDQLDDGYDPLGMMDDPLGEMD